MTAFNYDAYLFQENVRKDYDLPSCDRVRYLKIFLQALDSFRILRAEYCDLHL